ncbi:MAG TPA: ABC transporter substrate-binding protein [Acetobacteraceae bacterium]|jgi:peptide/nickel transport system substrate-binding protein|nr:ABC transporter substrate-binding protein [Acetobacteraceae bacterium]
MLTKTRKTLMLAATSLCLLSGAAHAQKSADTLRLVWWDQIVNVNPYYNQLRAGLVVAHQAFDGLVYRDPETFKVVPLLAESWKYADPTTLEFKLRHGVKFHDGSPLSADDVVYTINLATTDKQVVVPSNYTWIAGATKIDDGTVQIKLKKIFPAALEYLAMVTPIIPKAYRERVGSDAYDKLPVGAGPYKITRIDGVNQIEMERFDDYYAGSPKPKPAIRRIVIHEVTDATTAQNEMIGGKADWTWNIIPDMVDKMAMLPGMTATRAEAMRVNFLNFDAAGRSGADNPLTKQKVRQAISYAIDRESIAKNLMQGDSRVPPAPCFPTQFGCDGSVATLYPYDPAKAKSLLSEAGYPNGFDTEIVSFLLPQFEGAVQGYLKAVGINAKISHLQVQAALQRSQAGQDPIDFTNWGSYSINDVSAFLPQFFSGAQESGFSTTDYAHDAEVQRLVKAGGSTTDPDDRKKSYSAAIKRITEQAYILPLFTGVVTYAYRKELNFQPWRDELPRYYLSSWK